MLRIDCRPHLSNVPVPPVGIYKFISYSCILQQPGSRAPRFARQTRISDQLYRPFAHPTEYRPRIRCLRAPESAPNSITHHTSPLRLHPVTCAILPRRTGAMWAMGKMGGMGAASATDANLRSSSRDFGGPRSATMAPAQHPSRPRMRRRTTIR